MEEFFLLSCFAMALTFVSVVGTLTIAYWAIFAPYEDPPTEDDK